MKSRRRLSSADALFILSAILTALIGWAEYPNSWGMK